MRKGLILVLTFLVFPLQAWADKVIMRDGKIYEGHIMGETSRSLLISNPPLDPKPRFIDLKDILTIVRESRPPEIATPETNRFATVETSLTGTVYTASTFSLSPAPGLHAGAGFRLHPAIEVDAGIDWVPALSGSFAVTDGSRDRGYEKFYAYAGGFMAKFFPFFMKEPRTIEPYLFTGYRWDRLVPKGSGDHVSGSSVLGGLGVSIPWHRPWYWELRAGFAHTSYSTIKFLTGEGELSGVRDNTVTFSAGLSYRFL